MADDQRFGESKDFPQCFHDVTNKHLTMWDRIVIELCYDICELRNYPDNLPWPKIEDHITPAQVYAEILERLKKQK